MIQSYTQADVTAVAVKLITAVGGSGSAPQGVAVRVENNDILIGGPDGQHYPVRQDELFQINLISGEELWAKSVTGTANVWVLSTRI